jgi:hypothetical protein
LRNDDRLHLDLLPAQLSIRAIVSGPVPGSVRFGYDVHEAYRVDSDAPYALEGDSAGDYVPAMFTSGEHVVTATPSAGANAAGAAGGTMVVKFRVGTQPAPPTNLRIVVE